MKDSHEWIIILLFSLFACVYKVCMGMWETLKHLVGLLVISCSLNVLYGIETFKSASACYLSDTIVHYVTTVLFLCVCACVCCMCMYMSYVYQLSDIGHCLCALLSLLEQYSQFYI